MGQSLNWKYRPEGLRAPALICAFRGWNDAGDAATTAVESIAKSLNARQFASIDSEDFYDFQNTRPLIVLDEQEHRTVLWPDVQISEARIPRAPRDLILVVGAEPSLKWRSFAATVTELAEQLDVQIVVTVGALLADVPHTRPVSVSSTSTDPALVERLDLHDPSYEGPTGIIGVLQDYCERADMPAASLWAAVPHYISASPNPKAALALIRTLERLVGVIFEAGELEQAAVDYERQVNLAVQSDPDIVAFVERLERATGTEDASPDLPSGDSIARDLQRFLRQRGNDE